VVAAGLKSYLAVPLTVGRATLGFMAFLSLRHERAWPLELIPRLQIIGQVFANAVVRKRAEEELRQSNAELQARNQELDAFAHTVAHDLKNPMDSIIQDLLLLSQVRQSEVQTQPLDMDSIVQEACQRLAQMSADYEAEITRPAASEWPVALGYGPWIEEVWVNYISNAIKYRSSLAVPPRVELGADPPSQAGGTKGEMVRFWMRDNGPGIAPEAQTRLFAMFERLGQVRLTGHGLGLSIVKRIVEKLGGQVGVESQVGQGSTFYFTLPAAPLVE
jgi:two-component system sensor histidine kinase/response regulator